MARKESPTDEQLEVICATVEHFAAHNARVQPEWAISKVELLAAGVRRLLGELASACDVLVAHNCTIVELQTRIAELENDLNAGKPS